MRLGQIVKGPVCCNEHAGPYFVDGDEDKPLYVLQWARSMISTVILETAGCRLKKKKQNMSAVSCFIWGKMRTIVWEKAFQIFLRNCSEVVGGRSVYM